MKRIALLLLLVLISVLSYTQVQQADSILEQINKTSDKSRKAQLYFNLAAIYEQDYLKCIEYTEKARDIALQVNDKEVNARSSLLLAEKYLDIAELDNAHDAALTTIALSKELKDKEYEYWGYIRIAEYFRRTADYDSTLLYLMTALRLAEKQLNDKWIALTFSDLGGYYSTLHDYDKAEEYHLKALALREQMKDTLRLANSYNNLGIISRNREDYPKALHWYFKARDIYAAIDDRSNIAFIFNDIGAAYSKSGKLDSGDYYLSKSIDMREQMNELIEIAYTYNYLGENYERMGDLKNAEKYIKKALSTAIEIKNNKQHYEADESLSDFYARNKMYDSAYKYLQLYKTFRDSIRRLDNDRLIAELNTRYETEKKEKKIQEQEFQLTKKNYMLGGVGFLLISGVLLTYSGYRRYKLKQETELQSTVMKQQEIATKAIIEAEENERQRIAGDLHDGVGQMMSAARINLSTAAKDINFKNEDQRIRFENALKLVDDSCSEVRNVSHTIMPNALLRKSLAAAVRSFIDKLDQHTIKINLHTEGLNEKLDEDIEIMLYRVVQECVNNTIKHAKADALDIMLVNEGYEISLTIEDNGVGFDTSDKTKFEGIGLKNIRSRVSYLKGSVEWDSRPGRGTVVSIHVPLQRSTTA